MKFLKLLFIQLLLIGSAVYAQDHHYISFESPEKLRDFLHWKTGQYPLISAHRGGPMKGFPENCIATFDNSTKYQPLIIEFDVALSKDSALVIMHDDKLDRTSTGTGPIGNYTYAELQKFSLKDVNGDVTPYKIPTLDEVLQWAKGKVILTIDIKKGVPFKKIIDAVRKNKAESCSIVITYNDSQAAEVHQLAPDLMISVSVNKPADVARLNQAGVPTNRMVAFVGTSAPALENYTYLHGLGISCILGTMGNLDKSAAANEAAGVYKALVNNGADVLSSDKLVLAGKQLDELRAEKKIKDKNIKVEHKR